MPKVQMLVDTYTPKNGYVHKGELVIVDDVTSKRWTMHGISKVVENETSEMPELMNAGVDELPTSEPEEVKKPAVKAKKSKPADEESRHD